MNQSHDLCTSQDQLPMQKLKHPRSWLKSGKGKRKTLAPLPHRVAPVAPMEAHFPGPLDSMGGAAALPPVTPPTPTPLKERRSWLASAKGKRKTLPSLRKGAGNRRLLTPLWLRATVHPSGDTSDKGSDSVHRPTPSEIFCKPRPLGPLPEEENSKESTEPTRNLTSTPDTQSDSQGTSKTVSWLEQVEYIVARPFFLSGSSSSTDQADHAEDRGELDDESPSSLGSAGSLLDPDLSSIDNIALGDDRPKASTDVLVGDLVPHAIAGEESAEPAIAQLNSLESYDGSSVKSRASKFFQVLVKTLACFGKCASVDTS